MTRGGWRLAIGLMVVFTRWGQADDAGRVDFNRDVRPILSDNCFLCHGPDDANRKGGLRLDQRNGALAAAESGEKSIVPGKPEASELVRRILSDDADLVMPPTASKKSRLTKSQVTILRRWIEQGAEYTSHWAFKAPERSALPQSTGTLADWPRNAVDTFILDKLKHEHLSPAPETDRITWLRRLSLDLIGLPPTVAEVDAFVADQSSDAHRKQIERLLASPHYGERWGRHWLDAARYADSDGFEKDKSRQVWFYRDWVVNSFNRDLPYDQFVIEQLAGDLLPNPTQDQIVATGFLRNSMLNEEGGVDPEQFRMDAMFDRMEAIGKSILGLTIQCAQCHTHKYDPITHDEYYRLFAFLNNDHEAQRIVYTTDELVKIADLHAQMNEVERQLKQATPDWATRMAAWEADLIAAQAAAPRWTSLKLANAGDNGQRYFDMDDGSILAQGYAPTKFTTLLRGDTDLKGITAIRLEQLNDPNLPCNGPGRSSLGTAALSEISVSVVNQKNPEQQSTVKFVKATADFGNAEKELEEQYKDKSGKRRVTGPVDFAIDGNDDTAWGIDAGPGRRNVPRQAVFVAEQPFGFEEGTTLTISLKQNHGGWNSDDNMNHNLGRFRLSATSAANAVADPVPETVRQAVSLPKDQRTAEQHAALFSYWRTTVADFKSANDQIEALWQHWPTGSTSLTLQQRMSPRDTRLLKRGDFLKPDKSVRPGVPAVLHPLAQANSANQLNRLTLAQWLVDRRSPTAARVIVNRVWQAYFGTGLVSTSEDLGTQSEVPSHPELLDWLAVELMSPEHLLPGETAVAPWSLKHLHRLIVGSALYRQSSRITDELYELDQFNRLLARAPRLRVEGEVVRDIALSASGLLNPKQGGPSVFSPAPAFLFQPPASYGPFTWTEATGAERYRRGLYTFRRRSTPYPMLTNFDTPNADSACVRRPRSNTPLQALTMLNETIFMEAARGLALLTVREGGGDTPSRLVFAFRRCVSRPPTESEQSLLLDLFEKQKSRFSSADAHPWELAANDPQNPPELPEGTSASDAAAWTVVSRVLLNLDETVTKE
ncbi:PSD1 and planctomycete cytochrome C domain-containing protein [Schlesneria paludicola]|uniref:PSD1 and planctomycete cytochrome C domain-containing protein n=1 Tax=Schlesneria paludicola TaxID=360056 RepID=UPI00029A9FAA|nr:PSD1 and planctomycete cytochrome C domain-containing protein [Schlesneria paludicola]